MHILKLIVRWLPYPNIVFGTAFFAVLMYSFGRPEARKYSLESGNIYLWKNHSDDYYFTFYQNLLLITLIGLMAGGILIGFFCTIIIKLRRL